MAKFVCQVCGYVYEGETAPEKCPVCRRSGFQVQRAGRRDDLGLLST